VGKSNATENESNGVIISLFDAGVLSFYKVWQYDIMLRWLLSVVSIANLVPMLIHNSISCWFLLQNF